MKDVQPIYIRAAHVQAVFGFHRSTLYRWVAAGHITLHKRGGASFVKVAEVMAFVEGPDDPGARESASDFKG